MPRLIEIMYKLQELENAIDGKEAALSQARAKQKESDELLAARAAYEGAKTNLNELKSRHTQAEWQMADLEAKIKELNQRLYSGRVTNPKELVSLNTELALLRDKHDQAETEALKLMEEIEQGGQELAEKEKAYNEAQERFRAEQEEIAHQVTLLEEEIKKLRSEREVLTLQIAPRDLELYQNIKQRKGTAVAMVERGTCTGCRITLSWAKLQQARGARPITCDNCERLLYMP